MFFGTKFDEMLDRCEEWEKEDMNKVEVGVGTFGMKTLGQMLDKEVKVTDKQTRDIVQGILFLITKYPDTKLIVNYHKQMIMVLPELIYLTEEEKKILTELGWEDYPKSPRLWEYSLDCDEYEYL